MTRVINKLPIISIPPPLPPSFTAPATCKQQKKNTYGYKPHSSKKKKTIKFIKYFDQHCFVACFETLFCLVISPTEYKPSLSHPPNISPPNPLRSCIISPGLIIKCLLYSRSGLAILVYDFPVHVMFIN